MSIPEKVIVSLSAAEALRVEQIVVDDDAGAALEFIRTVVKPQVEAGLRPGCRPFFEWGNRPIGGVKGPQAAPSP